MAIQMWMCQKCKQKIGKLIPSDVEGEIPPICTHGGKTSRTNPSRQMVKVTK